MKEQFTRHRLNRSSLTLLNQIEPVLEDYRRDGYIITVRQLYYRLVGLGILKENNIKVYKQIVGLLTKARMNGLIDWRMFEDVERRLIGNSHWDDPKDFMRCAADSYMMDKWDNQPNYVEVMVEKNALASILERVTRELDVKLTPNRGYSSASFFYNAGKRYRRQAAKGKDVHILYLGDHDPSGIDMSRDMTTRLELFAGDPIDEDDNGPTPMELNIHRIALNMDQVRELNPPENFAKSSDDRTPAYVTKFGDKCWELDAVEPRALDKILRDKILSLRDDAKWKLMVDEEAARIESLKRFADTYGQPAQTIKPKRKSKKDALAKLMAQLSDPDQHITVA